MKRQKIRFKTWYYGKFVLEGDHGFKLNEPGFEVYSEETHGWKNSEEYKHGLLFPYNEKD